MAQSHTAVPILQGYRRRGRGRNSRLKVWSFFSDPGSRKGENQSFSKVFNQHIPAKKKLSQVLNEICRGVIILIDTSVTWSPHLIFQSGLTCRLLSISVLMRLRLRLLSHLRAQLDPSLRQLEVGYNRSVVGFGIEKSLSEDCGGIVQ